MPLFFLQRTGEKSAQFGHSVVFFFQFLGHFCRTLTHNWFSVTWKDSLFNTLRAGALIVLPLSIMSMLIGMSLALSIHYTLARYNLQHNAMFIAQTTILRNVAPLPIGFVLCVHGGLNLIDSHHPSLRHPPEQVLRETIIPLTLAIGITAVFLYAYVFASFIFGIFLAFYYILEINMNEYLFRLEQTITPLELIISLGKTLLYATIASLIAGYYYYDVSIRVMPIRKAVSRTITRGLFWLIVIAVSLNMLIGLD